MATTLQKIEQQHRAREVSLALFLVNQAFTELCKSPDDFWRWDEIAFSLKSIQLLCERGAEDAVDARNEQLQLDGFTIKTNFSEGVSTW